MKRVILLIGLCSVVAGAIAAEADSPAGKCMTCHKEKTPGLYKQWFASNHGSAGVTCLDCHGAAAGESDAFPHEGAHIATLVTPRDCGQCHAKEAEQVQKSHHATAGEILDSNDAYLAHATGGQPAAVAGCESCHGGKVKIDPASPNKLSRLSWPNSGIGRLNPDGSKGSCTACHARHSFDVAQARKPEACAKCHLGPDHPQKEIYEESKHGNAYYTHLDEMNIESDRWVVGVDYFEAPTCATCHMSATRTQPVTHEVGERISWTLRPPVSKTLPNWQVRRQNMQDVCRACHGQGFIDGHYAQYDGLVNLYNEKFAKPAGRLYDIAKRKGLGGGKAEFSNEYEWTYWEIWHHEGRRARHGAAMMGPDYTWWHGIYEVGKHFYFEFIPELREFHDAELDQAIAEVLADEFHVWLNRPTADIKADIKSGAMAKLYADMFEGPLGQ
ncbi:MAG TPA: multiheme c-type cytochrome [Candidatus Krumholzibacteria bacterium]|nr:multiheme c-type cytochrome [Candidatus Krumholzibacteria bacterium]HPD72646.1 multiheme c-type cytochrome [Candidatus Krumholzibacteria bacterium]HRY40422.1 multiheme c-type cytochrome [Candidatus Krumholzibacteria bacterium]